MHGNARIRSGLRWSRAEFFADGCGAGEKGIPMAMGQITVVGGGLAGAEAAYQAACRGAEVRLYEMRPEVGTAMHGGSLLAELTGSGCFGPEQVDRATGLLIHELRELGSVIVEAADATAIIRDAVLCVDRRAFAEHVTEAIEQHPGIEVVRAETAPMATETPVVVATGPLTSSLAARALFRLTGEEFGFYYGACEPLLAADSLDDSRIWSQSRFDEGEPIYRNCAIDEEQFERFVGVLAEYGNGLGEGVATAEVYHEYKPLEVAVAEGEKPLNASRLSAGGFTDPTIGRQPAAVCQLCPDDADGTTWRAVNMHTGLPPTQQHRLLAEVGGLERAEFVRYGRLHRAVCVNAPLVLEPTYELAQHRGVFIAGALTGVVGYTAAAASGWLAGVNAVRRLEERDAVALPVTSLCGAMAEALVGGSGVHSRPFAVNFGMVRSDETEGEGSKEQRRLAKAERALASLVEFCRDKALGPAGPGMNGN
jgi:methylenetetrahydrofolate--tRNA-(uracil-5-)-methyltransferase